MKKNLLVLGLLVILTFPAWKALRHPGMISGHDGESAVFKSEEFYEALSDGQFPPRWAKRLNYGLGQPTFTFTYTLPYYITSALMAVGTGPVWAYKILMAASIPLGGFFVYLWLRERFGKLTAFLAGVIYAYLPYHLLNVYVRGAVGETTAATLLPLTFWTLDSFSPAVISLVIGATILAHPFYGMIFGPIWLLYSWKNKQKWPGVAWGYVNTVFFLLPAFAYKNLTFLDKLGEYFIQKQSFINIGQLIYSSWNYSGIDALGNTNTSVMVGTVVLILFLGFAGLWITHPKKVKESRDYFQLIIFCLVTLAGVFMMTRPSLVIWQALPLLQSLQFPWRLLSVVTMTMLFCGSFFLSAAVRKSPIVVSGIVVLTVVLAASGQMKPERNYPWIDPTRQSLGYRGTYTMLLEETPKWHNIYDEYNHLHAYEPTKTEKGDFDIDWILWKSNYHRLIVYSTQGGTLSDKTHYWPGWKVYIDGRETRLYDPYNPYSHGLVTFDVPAGKHLVETKLTEPPLNLAADALSLGGIGYAVYLMLRSRHEAVA